MSFIVQEAASPERSFPASGYFTNQKVQWIKHIYVHDYSVFSFQIIQVFELYVYKTPEVFCHSKDINI